MAITPCDEALHDNAVPSARPALVWREPWHLWAIFSLFLGIMMVLFGDGVAFMVDRWLTQDEYSHGILIPLISGFLIWQKRGELELLKFSGSWLGLCLVFAGLLGWFVGELSSLYTIIQYSFLISLYGLFLSIMGWRAFKKILAPLLILFFMIPLPNFIYNNLSSELQLISSSIGVWFIRLFDISVYLEGNVIDLGSLKLQVVEACNGLRYLFPLMTLGVIIAYFAKIALWKRVLIFISSIPVTILMNSFRIGAIGLTVEYWGRSAAEGILHDFEGWIVFMFSFAVLFLETWFLSRLGADGRKPFKQVFGLDVMPRSDNPGKIEHRKTPRPFIICGVLLLLGVSFLFTDLQNRDEVIPVREQFDFFPMKLGDFRGSPGFLEQHYIDVLQLNDYLLADYRDNNRNLVNLYMAYYDTQRKGASAHSPRSCIPGGGWVIQDLSQRSIPVQTSAGQNLSVNRVLIKSGRQTQLVYYWFQQRGRIITNEYLVKWYIFWDALTRSRTDGALVRLTVRIDDSTDVQFADELLSGFAQDLLTVTDDYIPL